MLFGNLFNGNIQISPKQDSKKLIEINAEQKHEMN